MKRNHWLYIVAALGGAAVWALIATISGKREAWDSDLYFIAGIPAVCLLALVLGYVEPLRPWRWGVAPQVGQLACMLLLQGVGNMLPLGVIMFGVLSIPSIITAWIGAAVGRRTARV
jgi:hypothetical protein